MQVVEALVFASDEPMPLDQIRSTIEDVTAAQVKEAIDGLNHVYSQSDRSFHIIEVAGGYQMVTREAYAHWIRRLFQRKIKARLSQAALETLSVIAFKQPITKTDVADIRGVSCDGVVKTLLERDLIAIAGRAEGPGRPLLYKTTKEFLRYFGLNNIKDLPKPREIDDLLKEEGAELTPIDEAQVRLALSEAPVQGEAEVAEAVVSDEENVSVVGEETLQSGPMEDDELNRETAASTASPDAEEEDDAAE